MSFRTKNFVSNKGCQIKINKHDSNCLILSKYYLDGKPQIKDILKEFGIKKFGKWQIKNKEHSLGHTIH